MTLTTHEYRLTCKSKTFFLFVESLPWEFNTVNMWAWFETPECACFENEQCEACGLTSCILSGTAVGCLSQLDPSAPLTSVSSGKPWGWAEGREKAEGRARWKTRVSEHCCKVSTPANGAVLGQGAPRIDPAKGGMYKPKINYCRGHGTAPSPTTAR